ncbi:glycosyltransferase [Mycobacterium sp. 236(2023)]|uniref:glycosyltransferase family 2 protein n=1 Tax=Mycobacterium sp. 236(2023) TaxID=3038163 RepID=UPI0024153AC6|nr:glycosyltransferase [Mycobacterium sp. 236(2023)]MDG4665376.1 glycosyltransferase [Mycobacterium sp. 236(2023)]
MAGRYLIAIATYLRPTGLQRLLDSLEVAIASAGLDVDVLIVDNDAEGSARSIAAAHGLGPTYVVEPEPGISAARNRALDHFGDSYRGIVFVDDDEWVSPTWLTTLTEYAVQTQADVVVGPVVSVFLEPAPEWVQRGGFFQGRSQVTGDHLRYAPTNNTLLVRDTWVRVGSPRFDPAFSTTGGEDTDLFHGIRKSGAAILFCAEAQVYEEVPTDRQSLGWVRRRAMREGANETRVLRKHRDSELLAALARGVRSGVYGILFLAVGLATRRGVQARPYFSLFYACGQFAALFNYQVEGYTRISKSQNSR